MNFFEKIVTFLQTRMPVPTPYGWFHLLSFAVVIGVSVLLAIKLRHSDNKTIKRFLLIVSITLIVLEIYKQIVFCYNAQSDTWTYQWYIFPFQFCSSPMYVCLLAALVKKGNFQDYLYSFLGTFALLAGALIMFVPTDVFMSFIGVNIQTMVHHGAMIVVGVVLLVNGACKTNLKTMLKASAVFGVLVFIALAIDCSYIWLGGTATCNMFFISPYFNTSLPVFSSIQPNVPYFVFLLLYIFAFCLAAFLVLGTAMLIKKLASKRKAASNNLDTANN
ncbi:MAG: hypothetical protein E7376_01440 [Clostridiales bacterium]|nr:hypothetical protein [Clostridiales bacterium]